MLITYLVRELRRRHRQALLISVGLAIGVGLVITVTSASAGVSAAQATVLHSLYGVGTDITVSQTAAAGSGGPSQFGLGPPAQSQSGQAFSRDRLTTGAQGTLDESSATSIAKLDKVAAVSSALQLTDINIQGHYSSATTAGGTATPRSGGSGGTGGSSPISFQSTTIDGISVGVSGLGPVSASEITSGHFFTSQDSAADDAVVSSTYAKQKGLKVGSTVSIAGTTFAVIGIASTSTSDVDLFIPLRVAQQLASLSGKVSQVYVQASSATEVSAVQSEIQKQVPSATVTTSSDLANQITGSLSSASTIISKLGLWLAIAVLIVTFAIACILTMGAVSRRVREFGTLKALGWRTRRIVAQVMAEAVVEGVVGAAIGVGLGFLGAALITHLAPPLTATTGGTAALGGGTFPGRAGSGTGVRGAGARRFPGAAGAGREAHLITVHLTAQVQPEVIVLAVGLAILGGLLAGFVGAWRASQLRPADALRSVA